ncbi:hypothetical protein FISHEDRAFT_64226 [Fistulina hepatica ATCC 64428]|uniref:3-oxo-5-alpha-steroid 4-dehydrogenase C-terminal domain-containing protein n=1 Tax=Fistulina hepatica ATCC 64428 TaxID=1128425 RepID=A0A0D7AIH1_9AGAR|nr:hypothetical protein FISHEDRAFT_64226 [Fistulina hepatica ATCC 64428]
MVAFRKWLLLTYGVFGPMTLFIDAPFGRFTPSKDSPLLVDGIKAWMIMEIFAPVSFLCAFLACPLSSSDSPRRYSTYQLILAGLFLAHYTNRAVISPLSTPSRSKAHFLVPIAGCFFNVLNGSLLGSYLSSSMAFAFLEKQSRVIFYIGLVLWAAGFVGNVAHDEILLDLRRKANSSAHDHKNRSSSSVGGAGSTGEYYGIPYGLLYSLVSYPNYLCEWVEWFGFALAAAPFPHVDFARLPMSLSALLESPLSQSLTPPYIFLLLEFATMLPRAYKGHLWYRRKFGDSYPANRKIVIPFLL